MQFVPTSSLWHLIDETAPLDTNMIAVLRGLVEDLSIQALCEVMLRPSDVPSKLAFKHDG